MMQNERFAEKLGEAAGQNGAVWLDYTGAASRLKMDGISGKSHNYSIGVGASHAHVGRADGSGPDRAYVDPPEDTGHQISRRQKAKTSPKIYIS